ncbi:EbsA family protein [Secundilactobacillus pentosiphilus]|uniref:EbsA family protein n=1 Tax=Secundilactobacillus pentosiphilus TaxID=1714682 RepID=UPI001CDA6272|nr:EbsA family protein [Secundilactobacillus pentosiphilus]
MNQKRKFLYQPAPLSSIILWSWTFCVLFLSLITGLEVSARLQWIAYTLGIIFLLLTWAQVHYRHIYLDNGTIRVSRVINHNWVNIRLKDVRQLHVSKYRLGFIYGGKIYQFIMPLNSTIELSNIISETRKEALK